MKRVIIIILFLFTFTIYLLTLTPTIYFGDAAEFCISSYLLDITHPPGYPLFSLLGKLISYLPINKIAFKINLLSSFFGSLVVCFVYLIIYYLPIKMEEWLKHLMGIFSSLLFAFSYTFFLHAIKAEVYTLYVLFFTIIIFLLFIFDKRGDIRIIYLIFFILGLALCNHLLILLLFTPICFFVLTSKNYKKLLTFRNFIIILFLSILLSIIYVYLPLRSAKEVNVNWGRPQNFVQFKYLTLLEENVNLYRVNPVVEAMCGKKYVNKKIWVEENYIELFIIILPFYFIFLFNSKKDYKRAYFLILYILLILALFFIFFRQCKQIQYYILNYIFTFSNIHIFTFSNIFDAVVKFFRYSFIFIVFITLLFYFSLQSKYRTKLIYTILIFTFILTIFTYCYLLKFTPGFTAHNLEVFAYLNYFINQYNLYLFLVGVIGIFYFLTHNLRLFTFFWLLFLSYSTLILLLIYPDYYPEMEERFCLPAYLILSIFAGFGIKLIIDYMTYYLRIKKGYFYFLFIIAFLPLIFHIKEVNKSKYYFAEDFAQDILDSLPKNSIFLSKGIDTTFALWYLNYAEKKREDVTIIYLAGLGEKWYIENLLARESVILPKLKDYFKTDVKRRREYTYQLIKNNIDKRPIYYGGEPFIIPEGIEAVIPQGIIFKVTEKGYKLTDEEIKNSYNLLKRYRFTKRMNKSFMDDWAREILTLYTGGYYKLASIYSNLGNSIEAKKLLKEVDKIDKGKR